MERANSAAVILGILFVVGVCGAAFIGGNALLKFRMSGRYVTVKGLAERDVKSDSASWKLKFKVSGNDFAATNKNVAQKIALVNQYLRDNNLKQEEMGSPSIRVMDLYAREYGSDKLPPLRYLIEVRFSINSKNVDVIEKAAAKTAELIAKGVILEENEYDQNPKYYFNNLNAIRPDILAEATQSARALAEQFAKDSGSKVGSIKFANQGVFHITDRDGFDATGISDMASVMKKVRVVSTIDYYLLD